MKHNYILEKPQICEFKTPCNVLAQGMLASGCSQEALQGVWFSPLSQNTLMFLPSQHTGNMPEFSSTGKWVGALQAMPVSSTAATDRRAEGGGNSEAQTDAAWMRPRAHG